MRHWYVRHASYNGHFGSIYKRLHYTNDQFTRQLCLTYRTDPSAGIRGLRVNGRPVYEACNENRFINDGPLNLDLFTLTARSKWCFDAFCMHCKYCKYIVSSKGKKVKL